MFACKPECKGVVTNFLLSLQLHPLYFGMQRDPNIAIKLVLHVMIDLTTPPQVSRMTKNISEFHKKIIYPRATNFVELKSFSHTNKAKENISNHRERVKKQTKNLMRQNCLCKKEISTWLDY